MMTKSVLIKKLMELPGGDDLPIYTEISNGEWEPLEPLQGVSIWFDCEGQPEYIDFKFSVI